MNSSDTQVKKGTLVVSLTRPSGRAAHRHIRIQKLASANRTGKPKPTNKVGCINFGRMFDP